MFVRSSTENMAMGASKTGPHSRRLLGNMWCAGNGAISMMSSHPRSGDIGYDIGELLVAKVSARPTSPISARPRQAERTWSGRRRFVFHAWVLIHSENLWDRSQFIKPRDREVVCHASAGASTCRCCASKFHQGQHRRLGDYPTMSWDIIISACL